MASSRIETLFSRGNLSDYLAERRLRLEQEVQQAAPDYILQVGEQTYLDYLVNRYSVEPLVLNTDNIHQLDPQDIQVDVSHDQNRYVSDRSKPVYIAGTRITVVIPYSGDPAMLSLRPSTWSTYLPRGEVTNGEVRLIYEQAGHDAERLARDIQNDIGTLRRYMQWIQGDVEGHNGQLSQFARSVFTARKNKILADRRLSAALNVPIKRRDNAPQSYAIPDVKRKVVPQRPSVPTGQPFEPEPALPLQEYEQILKIIRNMVSVMERSPSAFAHMGEEDLRQHFLVQLNGQYEGQATGETFNFSGKTDILIRYQDRNIFIAECKFWRGSQGLTSTIDQLLEYITWRDTKTAVLLFNRDTQFSTVLARIPEVVRQHPCFVQEIGVSDSTVFRYRFHQPNDLNRELLLTVMAFDIPHVSKVSAKLT